MRAFEDQLPSHERRASPFRGQTLRNQILLAFVAMSLITASLGVFAVSKLSREGELVDRTFDRSLMAINYARAASADFNGLQATLARSLLTKDRHDLGPAKVELETLAQTMDDDLSIAVERAQSVRAAEAGTRIGTAVKAWYAEALALLVMEDPSAAWTTLDKHASVIGQQFDLLINYTAGDGFTYRQTAHRAVNEDKRFNLMMTMLAVMTSGVIAWLLARQITGPIRNASHVAARIADGDLDVVVPQGRADEIGTLLVAMERMRSHIKASMRREVELRESAQMRLADALEHSSEGVVLVDKDRKLALVNARAADLLSGFAGPLEAADDAAPLLAKLAHLKADGGEGMQRREIACADGRWINLSDNETRDGGRVIICSDISLVKAQQTALNTTNYWLDAALSNLSQGLALFDGDGRLKVFNRRFCEIFGLPADRMAPGMTLRELIELGFLSQPVWVDKAAFTSQVETRTSAARRAEKLLELADERKVAMTHSPLDGGGWLATYEDVTDRVEAQRKIAFMARHDALTQLPNRTTFAEQIEQALAEARRGSRFAVLCLDLDHFKQINDTLGHPIGDDLLCEVATRLKSCLRMTDMVARLGGDEFAIIQTRLESAQDADALGRRIITALNAPYDIQGNKFSIGVSIGVSIAPEDGTQYLGLLKNADLALYRAKTDGRNALRFFEPGMDEVLRARRAIELDLRKAMERGELEVHYQPVIDIAARRVCGAEALLRWRHPERGMISPGEFIPIAEEIGMIAPIGDWVLERACRDALAWPDDLTVAVNVSAAQVRDSNLIHRIIETLYATGLPPSRLDLEITESVLLNNTGPTLTTLQRIRELGVRISMDDFGTGYSSLSYLRSFPFDRLKIDQSFTRDMRSGSRAIIRTIVDLCRNLGMRTIAEGVETPEQLDMVREMGCDEAQGFYFSAAVPADGIGAIVLALDGGEGDFDATFRLLVAPGPNVEDAA